MCSTVYHHTSYMFLSGFVLLKIYCSLKLLKVRMPFSCHKVLSVPTFHSKCVVVTLHKYHFCYITQILLFFCQKNINCSFKHYSNLRTTKNKTMIIMLPKKCIFWSTSSTATFHLLIFNFLKLTPTHASLILQRQRRKGKNRD